MSFPYRGRKGPLDLLIGSTGIEAEGEGEWNARKHGGPKRRLWRKIHIGIDKETLQVLAVEFTGSKIGDAPILPELLDQIGADQDLASVTADAARSVSPSRAKGSPTLNRFAQPGHAALAIQVRYQVLPGRRDMAASASIAC